MAEAQPPDQPVLPEPPDWPRVVERLQERHLASEESKPKGSRSRKIAGTAFDAVYAAAAVASLKPEAITHATERVAESIVGSDRYKSLDDRRQQNYRRMFEAVVDQDESVLLAAPGNLLVRQQGLRLVANRLSFGLYGMLAGAGVMALTDMRLLFLKTNWRLRPSGKLLLDEPLAAIQPVILIGVWRGTYDMTFKKQTGMWWKQWTFRVGNSSHPVASGMFDVLSCISEVQSQPPTDT